MLLFDFKRIPSQQHLRDHLIRTYILHLLDVKQGERVSLFQRELHHDRKIRNRAAARPASQPSHRVVGRPLNRVATWRPRDHAVAQPRDCEQGQPVTQPGREWPRARPTGLAGLARGLSTPRPA